jgi:hypothetical protein
MGIHYDYKSTRGAKKMQKQQQREQRRRKKKTRPMPAQKIPDESKPLTLDMITDPTNDKPRLFDHYGIDTQKDMGSNHLCQAMGHGTHRQARILLRL